MVDTRKHCIQRVWELFDKHLKETWDIWLYVEFGLHKQSEEFPYVQVKQVMTSTEDIRREVWLYELIIY